MQVAENFVRNTGVRKLPVENIFTSEINPRKRFDEGKLTELMESIMTHGLLEPIVVRPRAEGGFSIVCGERRFRAVKMSGLREIDATVLEDVDDMRARELAIIENVCREDIDPMEEARAYAELAEMGYTQNQIAERVNRSQGAVANTIRLLKLPEELQAEVSEGNLTVTAARAMLPYAESPTVVKAFRKMLAQGTPTRELEKPNQSTISELRYRHQAIKFLGGSECVFDKSGCLECPNFRCFTKNEDPYCLDPDCFDARNKEIAEARVAKAVAAIGGDSSKLPKLSESGLKYSDYEQLDEYAHRPRPSACGGDECQDCKAYLGYNNKPGLFCLKPDCFRDLQREDSRSKFQSEREQREELVSNALAVLDANTEESGAAASAVLAGAIINAADPSTVSAALKRLGYSIAYPEISELSKSGRKNLKALLDALVVVPAQELNKLTSEILMRNEVYLYGPGGKEQYSHVFKFGPIATKWIAERTESTVSSSTDETINQDDFDWIVNCSASDTNCISAVTRADLPTLKAALSYEKSHKCRSTLIARLESRIKALGGTPQEDAPAPLTREQIEARCKDCDKCGNGVGAAMPALTGPICIASPSEGKGTYKSIYTVQICPNGRA